MVALLQGNQPLQFPSSVGDLIEVDASSICGLRSTIHAFRASALTTLITTSCSCTSTYNYCCSSSYASSYCCSEHRHILLQAVPYRVQVAHVLRMRHDQAGPRRDRRRPVTEQFGHVIEVRVDTNTTTVVSIVVQLPVLVEMRIQLHEGLEAQGGALQEGLQLVRVLKNRMRNQVVEKHLELASTLIGLILRIGQEVPIFQRQRRHHHRLVIVL
mmetsp:Transcript_59909/g.122970  ORF Transcript_59909/g.122970 Transcript_59909/m.122970 type:complete len:214 (-) Transcript_59909:363-1004(-)